MKDKATILSSLNAEDQTFNMVVIAPKYQQKKTQKEFKDSQVKIGMKHVSVIDKINLHKQTK